MSSSAAIAFHALPVARMLTIRRRSSSLGAGRWSSVPAASTSDIASSSSRPYFFSRRTSRRRSSPSAGLRASSPSRTARARISESRCRCELIVCGRSGCIARPRPSIERLADRERCLDPAVLGELSVEVGLDVAARQLGHDDVAEVRQQVDLELALHVGQAVRAQSLSDFALVVLVGELRDRRDFALDVVGLQRRAPGPGEDLAGDQPCLVFGTCTIHALVAAPEADHLGGVARGRGTARCSSRRRSRAVCSRICPVGLRGIRGECYRRGRARNSPCAVSASRARRAGTDRRRRRGGGTPTIRCTPSRGMRSGAVCPVPSLTAPSSPACS